MATKIMHCTCEHVFQDRMRGKKMRVHNESKDGKDIMWTCTVCGKKKQGVGRR